jgi:hypothetical protein
MDALFRAVVCRYDVSYIDGVVSGDPSLRVSASHDLWNCRRLLGRLILNRAKTNTDAPLF